MFTEKQVKELEAKLDGSSVKERTQAGRTFSYIEGWHAIAEANRIFGFDGWTRETMETRLVAEKERKVGKGQYERDGWGVSYIAKVRITVRVDEDDSIVTREGIGAGHGIDADQGLAHESAIKEAETDAMKRALMTFGNPFGLALYDKTQEGVEKQPGKAAGGYARAAALEPAERTAIAQKAANARWGNGETSVQVADNAADAKADALIGQINTLRTADEWEELKADPDYRALYKRLSPSKQALVLQAGRRKAESFAPPVMAG